MRILTDIFTNREISHSVTGQFLTKTTLIPLLSYIDEDPCVFLTVCGSTS